MHSIKVSVIVPIYNVEAYLSECLETLIKQTLSEIEIICVDDGSTDNSLDILTTYSKKDNRIKILQQKNQYAGVARNNGLKIASGKYVIFLDSDDFFALDLLEKTYNQAERTNADIVLFDAKCFDTSVNEYIDKAHYFRRDYIGNKTVFSRKDFPDKLFTITTPCPWTKLFQKDFISQHKLQFQALQNSNDTFFVLSALALAERISYVNDKLVYYRIGQQNNTQSVKTKNPLLFFEAYEAVYDLLNENGIYKELEKTFVTTMISGCIYNLDSVQTNEAKDQICQALTSPHFTRMGLLNHPVSFYSDKKKFLRLRGISHIVAWKKKASRTMNENFRIVVDSRPQSETYKPLVSVIVPVYNVADYLEACISSLTKQSLKNIEIICVNDGSTDNSYEVLMNLAENDKRLVVCTQKNSGQSATRNIAIKQARGTYLYFMDSDDILVPNALELLHEQAQNKNLDILYFDGSCFSDSPECYEQVKKNEHYYTRSKSYDDIYTGENLMKEMNENGEYRVSPCLQFINHEYFLNHDLYFFNGIVHEDNLFNYKCMSNASRVSHIAEPLFLRRYRPASTMTESTNFSHVYGYFKCYLEMLDFYKKHSFSPECEPAALEIIYRILYNTRATYLELPDEQKDLALGLSTYEAQLFKWYVSDFCALKAQISGTSKKNISSFAVTSRENALEKRVFELENSTTFKVGKVIMFIPCTIKDWFIKCRKKNK